MDFEKDRERKEEEGTSYVHNIIEMRLKIEKDDNLTSICLIFYSEISSIFAHLNFSFISIFVQGLQYCHHFCKTRVENFKIINF